MARHEEDREDLIREAVALPDRVELQVPSFEEPVTIGFRPNSAISIFVGQDPVYQFDPEGRLRRAYVAGLLYRSQHATLAMLRRERTETQTLLLRSDLDAPEAALFCRQMNDLLQALKLKLMAGEFETIRSVPQSADHVPRILAALESVQLADPWLSPTINRRN